MRERIEAHLGSRQVARVVYGAIIGLAVIVALQGHPPSAAKMIWTLLGTALAVALAEIYSDVIGTETRMRQLVRRSDVGHILDDAAAVAFGVAFPAVFFLLDAVGAIAPGTAYTLAKWTGLGWIGFYGFCAARLAGATYRRSTVHALAVAAIGGIVIALKALIH